MSHANSQATHMNVGRALGDDDTMSIPGLLWGMPALVDRGDTYDSDDDTTVPRLLSHDEMSFSSES